MTSPTENLDHQYRCWMTKAPLALVLTGFGVCLISEAAAAKQSGAAMGKWVSRGTLALTVFNAGLSILVDAGKHRAHYERLRDAAKMSKKDAED